MELAVYHLSLLVPPTLGLKLHVHCILEIRSDVTVLARPLILVEIRFALMILSPLQMEIVILVFQDVKLKIQDVSQPQNPVIHIVDLRPSAVYLREQMEVRNVTMILV